jgi:N-acetylated-alpha-linked acidic dipeptidase
MSSSQAVKMLGYGLQSAARQREIERRAVELARTESLAEFVRTLASRPHVAGTEPQARTRDYVIQQMQSWGLQTSLAEYEVYLPHPIDVVLERLSPAPRRFTLREPPLPQAPGCTDPEQWPAWHGFAAAGDVRGQIVYVNYARLEDLDRLAELGVQLAGKIALARYGEIFRGHKVLNVQHRGAVGCILYSDPFDDGYFRGDVYPAGSMRPAESIQRGGLNVVNGDPTAPGRVSLEGVERTAPEEVPTLPRIPSLPIGYNVAEELLRTLQGPEVPQEWQGALPFRYHLGPGPAEVRLKVEHDRGCRKIWNTFGQITGNQRPGKWVIVGAHRDAWGCGATDNATGVACVLEAARVCAELARTGYRPKRTLIFATWDAEEWGMIGSTEWVEQERASLEASAVAYINLDLPVAGPDFGATGSPAMEALVRDVAAVVPAPDAADQSLLEAWSASKESPSRLGPPGGGSDHEPFFLHLGIPYVSHAFSGRWGNYHSAYDVPDWLERLGDPGYRRLRAAATLTATLALRLANADGLPLDYLTYLDALEKAMAELKARAAATEGLAGVSFDRLAQAVTDLRPAAAAVTKLLDNADWDQVSDAQRSAFNQAIRQVEPTLTRPTDRGPDEFRRNLVFGVDPRSGYRGWMLPGVTTAVEAAEPIRTAAEIALLADRMASATALLRQARAASWPGGDA